jgi:hypothetical protein
MEKVAPRGIPCWIKSMHSLESNGRVGALSCGIADSVVYTIGSQFVSQLGFIPLIMHLHASRSACLRLSLVHKAIRTEHV